MIYLLVLIYFVVVIQVFAMDQDKIIEHENKLMEAMGTNSSDLLVEIIAQTEKGIEKLGGLEYNLEKARLGIYYHNLALHGFKMGYRGFAEKSFETLRQIYENPTCEPELRPIILSYLDSSRTIMGGQTSNPLNKVRFVQDGLKYLDEAVNKYKDYSYIPCFKSFRFSLAIRFSGKPKLFWRKGEKGRPSYVA